MSKVVIGNKMVVLQTKQIEYLDIFKSRMKFFRNGKDAMKDAEGKDSKAFIVPTINRAKELGIDNIDVLVCTGIKIVYNTKGVTYTCTVTGEDIGYDYYYEFKQMERIPYKAFKAIFGDLYKSRSMVGGNNFFFNNPIEDSPTRDSNRASKKK
jgi:hypothetical protein